MEERKFLSLPAEIRINIFEYVFQDNALIDGFKSHEVPGGIYLDEEYSANDHLQALSTCRQFYRDGCLLALSRTTFIVSNLFFHIPARLSVMHPKQIAALRTIAFVADARHFRKLLDWGTSPFGMPSLHLDTLTIVLHRSSFWHYLFDFTTDVVKLLRHLRGVRRFVFVRNAALVKGSFKTWYNRLVGLIMKTDHHERYEKDPPCCESTWWKWSYDEVAQSFCLEALPPRPLVESEGEYMLQMSPLLEQLRESVETEEWNPDPRARNHYY